MEVLNNNFVDLNYNELTSIEGGKGWGWLAFAEPVWDFVTGIAHGFGDAAKNS